MQEPLNKMDTSEQTDLAMYASQVVPTLTHDKQHPVLDIEKADNFILAYYAGGQLQPKGLPSELENEPKIEAKPGELNGYLQHIEVGERGVGIGGSANGATIVTGDDNIVGSSNVVQKNVTQRGKYNVQSG